MSEASLDVPSTKERWLAAIPLLLSFLILAYTVPRVGNYIEIFRSLRLELPLPTMLAISWGRGIANHFYLCMPVMFALCALHFGWAAKSRARLLWLNQIWMFSFLLIAFVFIAGVMLPFIKIQKGLRKK